MESTVVTQQSWCGRLANSFVGVIVGVILTIAAIPVLFVNEHRAVTDYQKLDAAQAAVVEASCSPSSKQLQANSDKLIYLSCPLQNLTALNDSLFPQVSAPEALFLKRDTQVYQWQESQRSETHKKSGKKVTVTTYTYSLGWSSAGSVALSHAKNFYVNPQWKLPDGKLVVPTHTVYSSTARIGAYDLPTFIRNDITSTKQLGLQAGNHTPPKNGNCSNHFDPAFKLAKDLAKKCTDRSGAPQCSSGCKSTTTQLKNMSCYREAIADSLYPSGDSDINMTVLNASIACDDQSGLKPRLANSTSKRLEGNFLWAGEEDKPILGDWKAQFAVNQYSSVSLIAQQKGNSFNLSIDEAALPAGFLFAEGDVSSDSLFTQARNAEKVLTWVLRVLGFLMMWMGMAMLAQPAAVMADGIPLCGACLGDMIECGICCGAFIVAAPLAMVIISIAWLAARPLLGAPLLGGAVLLLLIWQCRARQRRQQKKAEAGSSASEHLLPNDYTFPVNAQQPVVQGYPTQPIAHPVQQPSGQYPPQQYPPQQYPPPQYPPQQYPPQQYQPQQDQAQQYPPQQYPPQQYPPQQYPPQQYPPQQYPPQQYPPQQDQAQQYPPQQYPPQQYPPQQQGPQ